MEHAVSSNFDHHSYNSHASVVEDKLNNVHMLIPVNIMVLYAQIRNQGNLFTVQDFVPDLYEF